MPTIAYRTVRSRRKFVRHAEVRRELSRVLDGPVKKRFLKQFSRIVASWKPENKPKFKARKFIRPDSISVDVFPTGNTEIYMFVTKGTKRHKIPSVPKSGVGKDFLFFRWAGPGSYKPKTGPRGKFRGPGRVSAGAPLVRMKQVDHPGNKPRDFEGVIRKRNLKWWRRTMENAWRRALRRV